MDSSPRRPVVTIALGALLVLVLAAASAFYVRDYLGRALYEEKVGEPLPPAPRHWAVYRGDGWRVAYPPDIFTRFGTSTTVLPPDYERAFGGFTMSHIAPVEHCDLSGLPEHCTPETEDLAISFFVVPRSYDDLAPAIDEAVSLEGKTFVGGRRGLYYHLGAEGEGIYGYLVPMDERRSFLVTRSYLDENILSGYRQVAGFISLAEQESLFWSLMGTLSFDE